MAQFDQALQLARAGMLGAVFHFEGDQLAAHFGDAIDCLIGFAAPAWEICDPPIVAGKPAPEGCGLVVGGRFRRIGLLAIRPYISIRFLARERIPG